MIIRLFEYGLDPDDEDAFHADLVDHGFPRLHDRDGLLFAYAGHDRADRAQHATVTAWRDFDALLATAGRDLNGPVFVSPASAGAMRAPRVSHWEAVALPAIGSGGSPRYLRVIRLSVAAGEAGYFEHVRRAVWPRLATQPGLVGAWVGRQVEERRAAVLAISVWSELEGPEFDESPVPLYEEEIGRQAVLEGVRQYDIEDAGAFPVPGMPR